MHQVGKIFLKVKYCPVRTVFKEEPAEAYKRASFSPKPFFSVREINREICNSVSVESPPNFINYRKRLKHLWIVAGGPGIEPGFLEPKSNVLPLDDPPTRAILYRAVPCSVKSLEES